MLDSSRFCNSSISALGPNELSRSCIVKAGAYDIKILDTDCHYIIGHRRLYFNPKENISRQDMMVLTARALEEFKGLKASSDNAILDKFSDKGDVAGYAVESLTTLVKEGLISGSGDKLNPRAQTTRAEAAVFLYRIYNKY